MMANGIVINARNAMAQMSIEIEVRVSKGSLFLIKIGVAVIKFGAWIAGIGEIKTKDIP